MKAGEPFDTILNLDARVAANSLTDEARERAQSTLTNLIRQLGSGQVLILVLALLKLFRDLDREIERWEGAVADRQRAIYEVINKNPPECDRLSAQQQVAHHQIARLHGIMRETRKRISLAIPGGV